MYKQNGDFVARVSTMAWKYIKSFEYELNCF